MSDFRLRPEKAPPDEERSAVWDACQREGRRRLLDELEVQGVPRYAHQGRTRIKEGPRGRLALRSHFRAKLALFRFLLDGTAYGRMRFLRFYPYAAMGAETAALMRRWERKRDRWIEAGCPQPPPWRLLETKEEMP